MIAALAMFFGQLLIVATVTGKNHASKGEVMLPDWHVVLLVLKALCATLEL